MLTLLKRSAPVVLLLNGLLAAPSLGQAIHGRLIDRGTGKPIPGAVVRLVTSGGQVGSGVLTDASGSYALTAPTAGLFRLRVERIGVEIELSDPVTLKAGDVTEYPLTVASRPVSLEGITVHGKSRGCAIREDAETVARVWEEARKALGALALSQSGEFVHFDTESFRRELDPITQEVRSEERRSIFDRTGSPYKSISTRELEEKGYVRVFADSMVFFAPDASVLLSDAFLDTHCFRMESSSDPGVIGLTFRPTRRASRPDVEGTLWLDRKTSSLRSADYRYVGHGLDVPSELTGGTIEFEQILPSRAWIVRRWVIRMPIVAVRKQRFQNPGTHGVQEHVETRVSAVVEEGGEVTAISTAGSTRRSAGLATVTGTVIDSIAGKPLPRAVVYLSGTSFSDTTDAAGQFRITGVPAGRYVVSFTHPRLRALGMFPPPKRGEVNPPAPLHVDLAIPALRTLVQRYCPTQKDGESMLVGHVTDVSSGEPVSGSHVRAVWTADGEVRSGSLIRVSRSGTVKTSSESAWISSKRRESETTTDDSGTFRVCGLPLETSIELEASDAPSMSRRTVRLGRDSLTLQDLMIERRR